MVRCWLIRVPPEDSSMARVSRNASIPYWPYSRPKPEYLNPPQGACGSSVIPLITTRPARICEATRRARLEVGPEDGGVETISRVVGNSDCLILGVIGDDTQNGAKNLFLGDRHVVFHVDENGGLHEVTRFKTCRMALATDEDFCAFLYTFADVRLHSLELVLGHHRSDGGLWIRRIADWKRAHRIHDRSLDRIESALRNEEPCPGGAGLSTIHKGQHKSRRNRLLESCIVEKDGGRFTPQFQRHALHRGGTVAHDRLANGNRARERYLGNVGIAHEFGPDNITAAYHDIADSLGEHQDAAQPPEAL